MHVRLHMSSSWYSPTHKQLSFSPVFTHFLSASCQLCSGLKKKGPQNKELEYYKQNTQRNKNLFSCSKTEVMQMTFSAFIHTGKKDGGEREKQSKYLLFAHIRNTHPLEWSPPAKTGEPVVCHCQPLGHPALNETVDPLAFEPWLQLWVSSRRPRL